MDVCCLQETEIPLNFPENILSTGGYNLELELNDNKKRTEIYIKNCSELVDYTLVQVQPY